MIGVIDQDRWQQASPYLDRALDLTGEARVACLLSLWDEDPDMAAHVEELLEEQRAVKRERFLDRTVSLDRLPSEPAAALSSVGSYSLVSPIGQGGMGSVWLAERNDGRFHGQAAVKLLDRAPAGRAVEERFKREGTILARLTHPHIARLIDAGVSAVGQPYLVLEYVNGRHIDRYCDEERLTIEDRIRLFLDVQSAVAHAHTNLIVHRDLKPSNVLVTANGQVKLLDFGIAKLLEGEAAAASMMTREGDVALTPKYAAPEQVTRGPITTATDVYALGVLLFELLSGRHPTGDTARSPAEFVKAVVDTEPAKLSAPGAHLDPAAEFVRATNRATTPEKLRRALAGDLDTILAKALRTDPAERYRSVAEFADDLRRFLAHEAIAARGDAIGYRAAKFLRRHRRGLSAAFATVSLVLGLVVFYTARLSAERDRARLQAVRASKVSELLTQLLAGADPYRTPDAKEPTVQNLLDLGAERIPAELGQEPELQVEMLTLIGRTYERMGLHEKARPLLERSLALGRAALAPQHVTLAQTLNDLGVLLREEGRLREAEPLLRESLEQRRRLLGPADKLVAVTLVELSRALDDQGRAAEAEPLAREALAIRRQLFGEEHRETATSKSDLGQLLMRRGDLAGAEPLLRENVATTERLLGRDHPNTAAAKGSLANLLVTKGDFEHAEPLLREALSVKRRVFGEGPEYAQTLNSLGQALELQARLDEAQTLYDQCVQIARRQLPPTHPRVLSYAANLARVRIARGEGATAEPSLRSVLHERQHLYPNGDWRIGQAQSLLGAALIARKQYGEAEPLMVAAATTLKPVAGPEGRERVENRKRLAALYEAIGDPRMAARYRAGS